MFGDPADADQGVARQFIKSEPGGGGAFWSRSHSRARGEPSRALGARGHRQAASRSRTTGVAKIGAATRRES